MYAITYRFHENTTIPDISPAIFDITATVSVSSHRWHTHLYWCITISMISQQVCKSSHLAHVWHHTQSTSRHIHTLWHQRTCFMTSFPIYITSHSHIMTSIIMFYDITNTLFTTSDLLYMTSHPLFRTSHHFMYDIKSSVSDLTSPVSVSSHSPYQWHHIHYMDGITSSISVTSYPLYLSHNIH